MYRDARSTVPIDLAAADCRACVLSDPYAGEAVVVD